MSILKVARMGHPVLRRPARPVEVDEIAQPWFQELVDDMIDTMKEYNGVGLAAPQVHEGVRVFVAALGAEDGDRDEVLVIVNPEIEPAGPEDVEGWEGCLSVPDVRGLVPRAEEIQVRGIDRTGRGLQLKASGFGARVIQHEVDHLDGVLFLDRMRSLETLTYLDEYSRFWAPDEKTDE